MTRKVWPAARTYAVMHGVSLEFTAKITLLSQDARRVVSFQSSKYLPWTQVLAIQSHAD